MQELESLWADVFGEPPSIRAEPGLMLQVLVATLPPAPPYAPHAPAPEPDDHAGASAIVAA